LNTILDMWDRNGSTSGPTSWQVYDDNDDDDDDDDDNNNNKAIGTISKSLRQHLSNIPGKHEVKEIQQTTILGTAHIQALREVLT